LSFFKLKPLEKSLFETYKPNIDLSDQSKSLFISGVGRSGTHFLSKIFENNEAVASYHLDNLKTATEDSFMMYCKWYKLSVDFAPFVDSRKFLIQNAFEDHKYYVESNPYLALIIEELANEFKSKILIVFRDPEKVVQSHLNKGWYSSINPIFDTNFMGPGFHYCHRNANHFFGRILPNNHIELERWTKLSQVGKVSWMWKVINENLLNASKNINNQNIMIVNIEKFEYEDYLKLCKFIDVNSDLDHFEFDTIKIQKPGKTQKKTFRDKWTDKEFDEFHNLTDSVYSQLKTLPNQINKF